MALKLGKCRLCLKLGDFYSIFTVDNSLQLAEMAMDCARIKIYEGDGLPDKVCSECIQKLSSAHIFKQQCERADQELRRNYVPPPGFRVSPSPNRQSSDSAFSNHTDLSASTSAKPSSSTERKHTPVGRPRKRSLESDHSARSRDNSFRSKPEQKRSRIESANNSRVEPANNSRVEPANDSRVESGDNSAQDSDYDNDNDDSVANYSDPDSDSNEPLIKDVHACKQCDRVFPSRKGMLIHVKRSHTATLGVDAVVDIPLDKPDAQDEVKDEEGQSCDKCGKTFKLKIMLKRHYDTCNTKPEPTPSLSPQKELQVTLQPIDRAKDRTEPINSDKKIDCQMCSTKFKTVDNLEKHMRVCHAAVLNKRPDVERPEPNKKVPVPCIFCNKHYDDYYVHAVHFNSCTKATTLTTFECKVCKKMFGRKNAYFLHIKNFHFEPRPTQTAKTTVGTFECRMCSKKLATQEALITHLAAHVSNIDDQSPSVDEESRASTIDDSASVASEQSTSAPGPLECKHCGKRFSYKKSLESHEAKHTPEETAVKAEPPDPDGKEADTSAFNQSVYRDTDSDSDLDDGETDNTCNICEKIFSYKRALIHHKRTKHHMSSGTKRAPVLAKDCKVQCVICDVEMTVGTFKEHNKKHIAENVRPKNIYTCCSCGETSMSLQGLGNHIKLVHRLKTQKPKKTYMPNPADFCEVVVTKSEPLDLVQSHNGFGEVPVEGPDANVDADEFPCALCGKKMPTLLSLKRHVNWHTNVGDSIEQKIECFVCLEKFRFKGHFRRHMKGHYNDTNLDPKFLTCTICNRRSKHLRGAQAHMNFHKQTRFKAKDYECSICKRVFQFRKVYLSHMNIHYKRGETIRNTIVGDCAKKDSKNLDNTCSLCNKVCDNEVSLKHHMAFHRSKASLFGARHECPFCALQFTNKRSMELHVRTHFEDENGPYKCTICGKGYTDEEYFRRHVKGHNFDHQSHQKRIAKLRENKVKCPICDKYYPGLVKLIGHLKRTHPESKMIKADPDAPPEKVYPCKLCAKVFRDEKRFKFHEEAHLRRPEFFKCKFCGKKTISLKNHNIHVKGHLTRKHVDNPLKCPQCDEHFIRGYDLHYHLRDVHNVLETWIADRTQQPLSGPLKQLQCSICMKVLASKGNYERHIDYHNSLRCHYCFDYFSALRFLEGHQSFACEKKKLIGETEVHPRKIKCHICYKAFHVQVKLDCHLRTQHGIKVSREVYEGSKEIVCDYCFKVFENENALQTHKVYHRTVGYYGCIYCDKKFNTLTNYRKHKTHHTSQLNVDNPSKCEHCDETFVSFREFIYHMKDDHGDDKEWIVMPKESIEEECPICKKVFFNLQRHIQYHEENRCKKCGEYFYSTLEFDNHLCSIDSEDEAETFAVEPPKYEECRFCFKPLTNSNSKLKHDLIHRGSGSISCRFCKLKFKTLDAFNIHSFTHRNRKYKKKPIKCRKCPEKFVQYGPFIKHMKVVHKSKNKMHYRAVVKPERCVVCGDYFPNLHNHYRAHLQNHCAGCDKYFTSTKVLTLHQCGKEDSDPSKVFTSDENLPALINSYVPKDERDDEKYYGMTEDEEEEEEKEKEEEEEAITSTTAVDSKVTYVNEHDNQISTEMEHLMPLSIQSPIISEVLSLYQEKDCDIIDITDVDNGPVDTGMVIDLIDDDSRD